MSVHWLLAALAAVCIFNVHCDTSPAGQVGMTEDTHGYFDAVFGFKPCMDESCEYGPSEFEPKPLYEGKIENPKVHCIMLRPSAVKAFGEIESAYPGISDIKYQLLEELIDHMYAFTSLKLENCQPAMQLIELIILAANSLKAQYTYQGGEDCIYTSSVNKTEKHLPGDEVTEIPCLPGSSDYVTGECPGSTKKPIVTEDSYVPTSATEKSYVPTMKPTEMPHVPGSTKRPATYDPSMTPCPDGVTTEKPCQPYVPTIKPTEKPYVPTIKPYEPSHMPCPDGVTTEKPCPPYVDTVTEEYSSEEIEIVAEEEPEIKIPQVGSMKGIPGEDYPNYTEIPITSFTCADKKYVPGFYADVETGCQVFHVCYEHRRESFLCPVGTIFNQPILACDYWYSSDCSAACDYYDVNEKTELKEEKIDEEVEELLTVIAESEMSEEHDIEKSHIESDLDKITSFFPVKAVVTDLEYETKVHIPTTPKAEEIAPEPVKPILKPVKQISFPDFKKPLKMQDLLKQVAVPIAKSKMTAIPVSKVTALKIVTPVVSLSAKAKISIPVAAAKAKLATKVAAIPAIKMAAAAPVLAKAKIAAVPFVAKAKVAAAAIPVAKVAVAAPALVKTKMAAIPVAKVAVAAPIIAKGKIAVPGVKMAAAKVAVKSSIPALKAKMVASAVPLAKSKMIPFMKAKVVKGAATPLLKAKMLALPLAKSKLAGPLPIAKVKLAKAAAISPLTKKALALGYMKLLKAKKLALMG